MPEARLEKLAATAERWGVIATVLTDDVRRRQTEELLARAWEIQSDDPELAREQSAWVDHSDTDGIPAHALPEGQRSETSRRSRFGVGQLEDTGCEIESTDGLSCWAAPPTTRARGCGPERH